MVIAVSLNTPVAIIMPLACQSSVIFLLSGTRHPSKFNLAPVVGVLTRHYPMSKYTARPKFPTCTNCHNYLEVVEVETDRHFLHKIEISIYLSHTFSYPGELTGIENSFLNSPSRLKANKRVYPATFFIINFDILDHTSPRSSCNIFTEEKAIRKCLS